jgi:hypothetical protein
MSSDGRADYLTLEKSVRPHHLLVYTQVLIAGLDNRS